MNRTKVLFKRLGTPVTILMVSHGRSKPVRMQVPAFVLFVCLILCISGAIFLADVSVSAIRYRQMETQLFHMTTQFNELKDSMHYLRKAERDFRKMFGLKSKIDVLELDDSAYANEILYSDSGSFDMKAIREQLDESMQSVAEIRDYIKNQKDIYRATPTGWPVNGKISSRYGYRSHPVFGEPRFHSGLDISVPHGTDVAVTADGIVNFSGRTTGGGFVVIVEHGYGFRTAYAHNSRVLVQVEQRVKRGDIIAQSGSSGVTTGPHLHYEVWLNGQHINPSDYLERQG
ncbi:MAG: M23 family metallopeptidase [Syntrophorhabdaceae bacterium]|nr:M23 family metallopeptidase [Syntrophorhabdaceae bacterium]